ncbi:hypothetical protein LSH36_92g06010 [Paralvinella palmiformis]|uniref:SEC63 domain-containing protein n=1 Tax=Paralvinella palmiformis TaxID=53620 RepID=A0AAD9K1E6_9ANNE|nr:hypothetical protein LSH36_92g06010 [Paralvinella palmiformis]
MSISNHHSNPGHLNNYYGLDSTDHGSVSSLLSCLIEKALIDLEESYCVEAEDATLSPTTLGRIASYYYINHLTVKMFRDKLSPSASIPELITIMSDAKEYAELPVRHNEDAINGGLAQRLPLEVNPHTYDSSHTKTHLLLQAHFCRETLPSSDYLTDTKSVLDQAVRVLQAMLDVSADQGWLVTTLQVIHLIQMVIQGAWWDRNALLTLPHVQLYHLYCFRTDGGRVMDALPELMCAVKGRLDVLKRMIRDDMSEKQIDELYDVLGRLPLIQISLSLMEQDESGKSAAQQIRQRTTRSSRDAWIPVQADQEYVLRVNMMRMNKTQQRRESKAFAPKFPKPKDEGWIFVLGEVETREVIALKRVAHVRQRSSVPVSFCTPEVEGRVIYTLYVMSDCYLGLDQQFDVCLDVQSAGGSGDVTADISEPSHVEDGW